MNISSLRFDQNGRFNKNDQAYFYENFKLIDKSPEVNSLDDADVIFIGYSHSELNQKIKNCWLIHQQARPGDTVFIETATERNENPLDFDLPSRVYVHAWDTLEPRRQSDIREALVRKGLSMLERLRSNASMTEIKEAARSANALIPSNSVEALEEKIKDFEKPKNYYSALQHQKICNTKAQRVEQAQTLGDVQKYFADFVPSITDFWMRFLVYSDGPGFITRNVTFGQNIISEKGKILAISGKAHLQYPKNPTLGEKESIEELKNILKTHNKKYVILFPKGKKGNIDQAKKFLEQQKPGFLTEIFYIFKFNKLLSASAFLLATARFFPNKEIYNITGFCMLTLFFSRILYNWYNLPSHSYKTMYALSDRCEVLIEKFKI